MDGHVEKVLIFSCNDVYKLDNFGHLARYIRDTVKAVKPTQYFVTMNGDFLAPSLLSSLDKGRLKVEIMNKIGFTHVCLGNHEFELSVGVLIDRLKEMKANVLNTNIHGLPEDLTIPYSANTVKLYNGEVDFTMGWLGFCTKAFDELCVNVPIEIHISKVEKHLQEWIDQLRQIAGCDFVVSLTHQDLDEDIHFIEHSTIDLVLGGHDHEPTVTQFHNSSQKPTWLAKVGKNLSHVGLVTITVPRDKKFTVNVERVELKKFGTRQRIERMITHGNDMIEQAHNRVLIAEPLEGVGGRGAPASLYTYILTKLRAFNEVDIALMHASLFKAGHDFPDGVTIFDLMKEFKFGQFTRGKIPGSLLVKFVREYRDKGNKRFIQVDGLVQFAEGTNEITHIGGLVIDHEKNYKVLLPVALCVLKEDDSQKYLCEDLLVHFEKHPKSLSFDRKHQPSAITNAITAALIAPDWGLIFKNLSFEDVDTNHDGVIDANELAAVVASEDVKEALLMVGDSNHDGLIDKQEWEAKMKAISAETQ